MKPTENQARHAYDLEEPNIKTAEAKSTDKASR